MVREDGGYGRGWFGGRGTEVEREEGIEGGRELCAAFGDRVRVSGRRHRGWG